MKKHFKKIDDIIIYLFAFLIFLFSSVKRINIITNADIPYTYILLLPIMIEITGIALYQVINLFKKIKKGLLYIIILELIYLTLTIISLVILGINKEWLYFSFHLIFSVYINLRIFIYNELDNKKNKDNNIITSNENLIQTLFLSIILGLMLIGISTEIWLYIFIGILSFISFILFFIFYFKNINENKASILSIVYYIFYTILPIPFILYIVIGGFVV